MATMMMRTRRTASTTKEGETRRTRNCQGEEGDHSSLRARSKEVPLVSFAWEKPSWRTRHLCHADHHTQTTVLISATIVVITLSPKRHSATILHPQLSILHPLRAIPRHSGPFRSFCLPYRAIPGHSGSVPVRFRVIPGHSGWVPATPAEMAMSLYVGRMIA